MGVAAIPAIIAGGTAVAQGVSSYGQGADQYAASEASRLLTNKNALDSFMTEIRAVETESDQINAKSASVSIETQKAAAQARGSAIANAGASGTGGSATDMQVGEINNTAARNLAINTLNKSNQLNSLDQQITSAKNKYSRRINLMEAQEPDMFSAILGGAASGASTYYGMTQGGTWDGY